VPGIFSQEQAETYFTYLRDNIAWDRSTMWMYDHEVAVPRLVASYGISEKLPPELADMRAELEGRLGVRFNAVGMNLYRDQKDSVAWHSDKNEDLIENPTVAILSFGAARPIGVRSKVPPRHAVFCDLEPGSSVVMSGHAQERFEHHIPKLQQIVGPRISVVFRTKRVQAEQAPTNQVSARAG
jgi:alkylated DNA repair dioxygenase AlkB